MSNSPRATWVSAGGGLSTLIGDVAVLRLSVAFVPRFRGIVSPHHAVALTP
jgi:hypothetical protein